jgi:hypothetical protein
VNVHCFFSFLVDGDDVYVVVVSAAASGFVVVLAVLAR